MPEICLLRAQPFQAIPIPTGAAAFYNLLYDRNIHLNHVTITDNSAGIGGGIYNRDKDENGTDTIWIRNSIVAGNSASSEADDLWGHFISDGNNLIRDVSGATITGDTETDIYGTDPLLGALGYYTYDTQHHPLSSGSPAIDKASESAFLPVDQLGIRRPFDGDTDNTPVADIGAVEFIPDEDRDGISNIEEDRKSVV